MDDYPFLEVVTAIYLHIKFLCRTGSPGIAEMIPQI